MNAQLIFDRGSRAGATVILSRPEVTVGRHQEADLRLDPEADLEVSARHALFFRFEGNWYIRDLGSRNGTLVNGTAIHTDVLLKEGDTIEFGVGGPLAHFHLLPEVAPEEPSEPVERPPRTEPFPIPEEAAAPSPASPPPSASTPPVLEAQAPSAASPSPAAPPVPEAGADPTRPSPASAEPEEAPSSTAPVEPAEVPPSPPAEVSPPPPLMEGGVGVDVRAEVKRQTRRLRYLAFFLLVALVVVGGTAILAIWTQRAQWARDVAAMEARIDSILQASGATAAELEGRLEGVRAALEQSQETLRELRSRLAAAEGRGDSERMAELQRQLLEAQAALHRHQLAAGVDYAAIEARNRPAIAKVFVEAATGEVFTATAFAVRSDGTLVTNRHVVAGVGGGTRPRRIGVQFTDSDQVWPARVLASSSEADLALLKIDNIRGPTPTVAALNERPDTVQPGRPVAVLGFPLGGGAPEGGLVARTTTTAGIVSSVGPALIRVAGYGAEGSSGSPILDENGEVIAVLFGGEGEEGARELVGVPSSQVINLLRSTLGVR